MYYYTIQEYPAYSISKNTKHLSDLPCRLFVWDSQEWMVKSSPTINYMGVSENVVCPIVPNGFADHYPVFKWLFHWEYTQHFQTNPYLNFEWFKNPREILATQGPIMKQKGGGQIPVDIPRICSHSMMTLVIMVVIFIILPGHPMK